jgi:hypothetical protein
MFFKALPKMPGNRRAGSPSEAAEFAALTKRDAQIRMVTELKDLVITCQEEDKLVLYN